MGIYKLNKAFHRDIGYFFVGMIIIYGISGIALNHIKDWNPNWIITTNEFQVSAPIEREEVNKEYINKMLTTVNENRNYKNHYFPNPTTLKIFLNDGSITVNMIDGNSVIETIKRRKVFYEMNFLHYNPGAAWMWFSDIFCVALIFLGISGLFILKGKKGLKWRGTIIMTIGLLIPILFLIYYL